MFVKAKRMPAPPIDEVEIRLNEREAKMLALILGIVSREQLDQFRHSFSISEMWALLTNLYNKLDDEVHNNGY